METGRKGIWPKVKESKRNPTENSFSTRFHLFNLQKWKRTENYFSVSFLFSSIEFLLLFGRFTVSFGPILIIFISVYLFSSVRFTISFCLFPYFFLPVSSFFQTFGWPDTFWMSMYSVILESLYRCILAFLYSKVFI